MSRVFLSGASGYVGSRLIGGLVSRGHKVGALVRRQVQLPPSCEPIVYDGGAQCIYEALHTGGFDVVVHLAANLQKVASISNVDALIESNVKLTTQLAQAATEVGASKFVNISTYSISIDGTNYRPQTLYAATKKAAEDILAYYHQSTSLRVCSLRLYDVYGPQQPHARFLNAVIDAVLTQQQLIMTRGEQDICFVEVDDVVDAIIHCVESAETYRDPLQNIFSIYGDEVIKVSDVPRRVAEVLGKDTPAIISSLDYRSNEVMEFKPMYPRLTGWKPSTPFEDGITKILTTRSK